MAKTTSPPENYQPERRNAQGEHDGGKHSPEEFDIQNPAKQVDDLKDDAPAPSDKSK